MKDVIQKQVAKTLEMAEQLVESLSAILVVMIVNKKFKPWRWNWVSEYIL